MSHKIMRALTVQGLWAWLIIHGPKRWENRPVRHTFRGELAIHIGKKKQWEQAAYNLAEQLGCDPPAPDDLTRQAIIGLVDVVDCVPVGEITDQDPFASGPFCLKLENVRPLAEPVPCRGFQSFWQVDPALARKIRRLTLAPVA